MLEDETAPRRAERPPRPAPRAAPRSIAVARRAARVHRAPAARTREVDAALLVDAAASMSRAAPRPARPRRRAAARARSSRSAATPPRRAPPASRPRTRTSRCSSKLTSGWRCRWRRQAITSSSTELTRRTLAECGRGPQRALLARQHLLQRVDIADPGDGRAPRRAAGRRPRRRPTTGLWSRLRDFDPDALGALPGGRRPGADDGSCARPSTWSPRATPRSPCARSCSPRSRRNHRGAFGRRMHGLEVDVDTVRELLNAGPMGAREARPRARRPGRGGGRERRPRLRAALPGAAARHPRQGGQARYARSSTAPRLKQRPTRPSWSALPRRLRPRHGQGLPEGGAASRGWKSVFAQLELVEVDRDLFDLPDAPARTASKRARPRPRRVTTTSCSATAGPPHHPARLPAGRRCSPTAAFVNNLLVGGMLGAAWWLEGDVLAVRPSGRSRRAEVEAEAAGFPWARDVRFEPPPSRAMSKPEVTIPEGSPSYQLELEDLTVGEGAEATAGSAAEECATSACPGRPAGSSTRPGTAATRSSSASARARSSRAGTRASPA